MVIATLGISQVSDLVRSARWDTALNTLVVELNLLASNIQANVWNTQTGELLLTIDRAPATATGFTVNNRRSTSIPCSVTVIAGARMQKATVANTGLICAQTVNAFDVIASQLPNSQIVYPQFDMTIRTGASLYFYTVVNPGFLYTWSFGGAAPVSYQAVPGNIVFSRPGVYTVTLRVKNAQGIVDPVVATRIITVVP